MVARPGIPFNRPGLLGRELEYLARAVRDNRHISGAGPYTRCCEKRLEELLAADMVRLTHSCTAALEIAAMISRGPDWEVALPSFTHVSTANAFHLHGARLRFVEILPDTLTLDPEDLAGKLSRHTRVVVPVHYAGIGCDMDRINRLARGCGALVVEDAAQALGAKYRARPLGTLGDFGAFSFHETKNISCGEGGALVVADTERHCGRVAAIMEKGTNREAFARGEVEEYTWVDVGSSYCPSDLLAAFLFAQLEHHDRVLARRRQIFFRYLELLEVPLQAGWLRAPSWPPHCEPNWHSFFLLAEDRPTRDGLLHHLNAQGIQAVFHYIPLHLSPMGQSLGYRRGDLPVTESLAGRLLRLPLFNSQTDEEVERVAAGVREYFTSQRCGRISDVAGS